MINNDEPKVSVIIPVYNRARLLEKAIVSILNQTYRNIEIIIVDDGSSDNTQEIFQSKFSSVAKYVYQPNQGVSSARNKGFALSVGHFINFLDSDDHFHPDNIREKVNILLQNPEIGWVFSDNLFATKNRNRYKNNLNLQKLAVKLESSTDSSDVFNLLLRKGVFLVTHSALIRRGCIEKIGGFNEKLMVYEDGEFFLRLARSFKVKYIHKPLVIVGYHNGESLSSSRSHYLSAFQYVEFVKKQFPKETLQMGWPPRFSKWRADIHNYFGMEYLKKHEKRMARNEFLQSIKSFPFQKKVYILLLRAFF